MPSLQPECRTLKLPCAAVGLVWLTLHEIFVPNVSRGWLLALRGALPIETLSSRTEEAAWIWTGVPNTLCDAVSICTLCYANSTTASATGCYSGKVSYIFQISWGPTTFCAKYFKARSAAQVLTLYCIGLELTSLLICCRGVMWTKTTFTLSFFLGWAFSHEFLFFSKSNDLLDRKEFLAIGCWYGLTTLYAGPCWHYVHSCPLPGWFPHVLFYLCSMWFSVMTSLVSQWAEKSGKGVTLVHAFEIST